MAKIKRSQFKTFLDTTPASTPTWSLIGDGVADAALNMNPETTSETYIHQDGATTNVEKYAPSMALDSVAVDGDAVFEFIEGLRRAQATLTDAETEVLDVYLYETPVSGAYPATKHSCSIAVDTTGGAGGVSNRISYTIYKNGDPVPGMFNPTTLAFVAD